jgi:hypothetical protein
MAFLPRRGFFLTHHLVSLLLLVIAGIQVILITQFDILIPMGVLVIGGAFSISFVIIIRVVWDEIYQRRRAAALGARLVPRVAGRWPGNIDVLIDAVDKMRNSYPGETSPISESR